jgi:hypothetical protein
MHGQETCFKHIAIECRSARNLRSSNKQVVFTQTHSMRKNSGSKLQAETDTNIHIDIFRQTYTDMGTNVHVDRDIHIHRHSHRAHNDIHTFISHE